MYLDLLKTAQNMCRNYGSVKSHVTLNQSINQLISDFRQDQNLGQAQKRLEFKIWE